MWKLPLRSQGSARAAVGQLGSVRACAALVWEVFRLDQFEWGPPGSSFNSSSSLRRSTMSKNRRATLFSISAVYASAIFAASSCRSAHQSAASFGGTLLNQQKSVISAAASPIVTSCTPTAPTTCSTTICSVTCSPSGTLVRVRDSGFSIRMDCAPRQARVGTFAPRQWGCRTFRGYTSKGIPDGHQKFIIRVAYLPFPGVLTRTGTRVLAVLTPRGEDPSDSTDLGTQQQNIYSLITHHFSITVQTT